MAEANPWLITPAYLSKEGLKFCDNSEEKQERRCLATNVRIFKSHYGKHPLHLCRVWSNLQVFNKMTVAEAKTRKCFLAFLLANYFIKCYQKADLCNSTFDVNFADMKEMSWDFVEHIGSLKPFKIKCPTVWPAKLGATCDGAHMATNEPRDPDMRRNPKNYSFEHNIASLNHQIVVSLWTNQIFYAGSGDPASAHGMTAIRKEFIDMVPVGGRVIADGGCVGKTEAEKRVFSTANNLDDPAVVEIKQRGKARQETINKRIKDYECMKQKFRHGVAKHQLCFDAVVVLVQYAIEDASSVGEPLDTL